ncbi:hypothetical protein [Streptomyces sp. NPDC096311]|uniref:hypothetical protein n=1 Tax=Streptomyces sp. NPDC096311 TaxID=3366083 RepID=UPI0038078EA0
MRVAAGRAQRRSGILATPWVSETDQDRHAQRSELLGSCTADPPVRPVISAIFWCVAYSVMTSSRLRDGGVQ